MDRTFQKTWGVLLVFLFLSTGLCYDKNGDEQPVKVSQTQSNEQDGIYQTEPLLFPEQQALAGSFSKEECQLRQQKKPDLAKSEIEATRKINSQNMDYKYDEVVINRQIQADQENVLLAKLFLDRNLSNELISSYQKGNYQKALSQIDESLKYSDTLMCRPLKCSIEKKPQDRKESKTGNDAEVSTTNTAKLEDEQGIGKKLPQQFTNRQGQKFQLIQPDEFMMGDPSTPAEAIKKYGPIDKWYLTTQPLHKVKITRPYYMGVYEVTVAQYRKFVDATGYITVAEKMGGAWGRNPKNEWRYRSGISWRKPGFEQTENHPVTCIVFKDIRAYLHWLNQEEKDSSHGMYYRLPTEAEWDNACRAGTNTDFFWGDRPEDGKGYINGWGKENSDLSNQNSSFPFDDGYQRTAPVGSFKPNPNGLYDMLGNVWEMCSDWYDDYSNEYVVDPKGPPNGIRHVRRGGGWNDSARGSGISRRDWSELDNPDSNIGFRLAFGTK